MLRERLRRWTNKLRPRGKSSPETWVTLGGTIHRIEPLGALEGIKLCMIVGPYMPRLWEINKTLGTTSTNEIKLEILRNLASEMGKFPGDLIRVVGLLIKREPEWLIENASATELFAALIELNEFSGFWDLMMMGMNLGLIELGIEDG